ncbi:mRNA binding protein puf3 [Fusarium piperis]|uniref:mRNA binding protein puf3 n=1 Tax=Fusarium piperis TaxID=1435070 RepID=A0A9W9BSD2_9HYPO|nr:mRNA binding protein puf3 [Fusarium piperis]
MPTQTNDRQQSISVPYTTDTSASNIWAYWNAVDDTPAGSNAGARNANTRTRPANAATRHANSGTRNMSSDDWRSGSSWVMGVPRTTSSPRDEGAIGNSINHSNNVFDGYDDAPIQDTMSYRRRSPQENTYMDSIGSFGRARDSSVPPQRQAQSPANLFSHAQTQGHTPSNSIQSQRPMPAHSSSFQHQSTNSRAFNTNRQQLSEDLSSEFTRRLTLDENSVPTMSNVGRSTFNPASQPFEARPSTQLTNGIDLSQDQLVTHLNSQLHGINRSSIDRIPTQNPRPEQARNSGLYMTAPDALSAIYGIPRAGPTSDQERLAATQYPSAGPYNQSPLPFYYPQYYDSFPQGLRPNIVPNYGLANLPQTYQLAGSVPIPPYRDADPGRDRRSIVLNDFRNRQRNRQQFTLSQIYGHIVEFSGDQQGSRFVQSQIDSANSDEKDRIFREIEPNAVQLMKDLFGNYVIQKFFDHGSQVQKSILADKMKGKMVDMSIQMYSCRVVQKALDHILVNQQAELVQELKEKIIEVIKDEHGNHVVQKIIQLVPREHIGFIMDAFKGRVKEFATHNYGCRVIQRILEHGLEDDKAMFLEELHNSWRFLFNDQYGNYVAQHIIEKGEPKDRDRVVTMVMSQLLTLSRQKQASNVVERCIKHCTPQQRTEMQKLITTVGEDGTMPLQHMMSDQFGNYVIQKLLKRVESVEREALKDKIRPLLDELRRSGTSKQVQAISRLLEDESESETATTPATTPASTPSATPALNTASALHVDVNSSTPTPVLTNESNSPQSSGPPSTNASAFGGLVGDDTDKLGNEARTVQVQDNEA